MTGCSLGGGGDGGAQRVPGEPRSECTDDGALHITIYLMLLSGVAGY